MVCPQCQLEHEDTAPCPGQTDARLGQGVAGYTVLRRLGQGRAGVVYLAEHAATGLKVAIKFLRPELVGTAAVRRLAREAHFANHLALESVVNVFDFSDDDAGGPFQVMEYLEGETVLDLVRRRIDPNEALALLSQVADTLEAAHQRGVVHAALTPTNTFVLPQEKDRLVRLLPFGTDAGPQEADDLPVAQLGAPDYRAPEQTRGAAADPRMDVYSLGGMAYLLATGRPPFQAPTQQALERAHAEVVPDAPHRVNPRVSRAWSAAILKALEKAPERRFPSAAAFAEALREAASAPPAAEAPAPAPPPAAEAPVSGGLAGDFIFTPVPQRPAPTNASSNAVRPVPSAPTTGSVRDTGHGLVLSATVTDEQGKLLGSFACTAVTRAGLVVCSTGALPALLSNVKLTFGELDGLSCTAKVVHHVTPEQAEQWKMSPGYGVQFEALSPEQRQRLEDAHHGRRPAETPSGVSRRPDDPEAAQLLQRFTGERSADSYALLSISKAAPFDAIRDRVRDAQRVLDRVEARPLSLAQKKLLEEARARLEMAGGCLGDPLNRLDYDAERGNFEGIARCINAGVTVTDLDAARKEFMYRHPGAGMKSQASIATAEACEARGAITQALDAYAEALRADPLNLAAQQRYWALRRRLEQA